jgi:hypothetical protein
MACVVFQSVQPAGMSERLPSGSTTSNSRVPRRFTMPISCNERPSNGCRSRRIVTEPERLRRWVVSFDRVNHDGLMARVAARLTDNRVLKLIRAFLNADGLRFEPYLFLPSPSADVILPRSCLLCRRHLRSAFMSFECMLAAGILELRLRGKYNGPVVFLSRSHSLGRF